MSFVIREITGSMLFLCLLCLISISNANTSPTINTFVYNVCEDTPIGETAFTIHATDAEGHPLTFSLTGPNAGFFTVNSVTGEVFVARQLDRESDNVMRLGVVVSDGPNFISSDLTIILLDANDNKPIFEQSSYDITIPENTPVGTSLFRARATDADSSAAGVVLYSIDEVIPSAGFRLFSIVNTTGEVKLSGSLNYTELNSFYQLKINATDGGGKCHFENVNYFSSIAFSSITVLDTADLDPQFTGLPYVGTVEENSPVGQSVFKVTAIDQDKGINDDLIYSIEDSTADGLFSISSDGGVITVKSLIDREVIGNSVTLTVKATESNVNVHGIHASTTANVQINIVDINDNIPEFYKCEGSGDMESCVKASHFTGKVFEHSLGSISISMTVKDLDMISETRLVLEGADKEVFSVVPELTLSDSEVQLLVRQPQDLDFEKIQEMVLEVIAIDEGNSTLRSTATVTVAIMDTNDNIPSFPQDTYKLTVAEHSPDGTIIANITAEDPDTMDQNNIIYRLLPDSILLYFDVEPRSGSIYVKNETLLDREVRSLYSATLQARDTDNKPGTTVLEITVTDINDQPPVFNRDSYTFFVKEGEELNAKIEATDADDSNTVNSQIVYGIEPSMYSDNFTIDPDTGVLTSKGGLDLEAMDPDLNGKIELNVTATDKGSPPLSTMVLVTIDVEDVNDNKPHFGNSSYTFSVKEGERGAYVGSVYAEDLDQTPEFNRISFSFIDGGFGFIIRTVKYERGYRGDISVDPDTELDFESAEKQFILQVEAADLEQETAEVTVTVNVLDVNDERPEFRPTGPETVKENTTITGVVGKFTGYDKDGNHSLIYELESIKCRCNGSLISCNSVILDPTGEVRLNPNYTLDYEQCDQVLIEAQVVDEFTEKGENNSVTTGQLVINIEDINDNAPEFIYSDAVFVVVSESASKGRKVAEVTATDRDSGINRKITFKVTAVQFENTNNQTSNMRLLFEAITSQQNDIYVGVIQTTEALDMTLKGKYLVTVTATDTGDLSTSTTLDIFTVDETYKVELEFTTSREEVEQNLNEIIRALAAATRTAVEIVNIRTVNSGPSRASDNTIIEAYFVYANGTALTSNQVEKMLSDPEHYLVLAQLGLKNIGTAPQNEPDTEPLRYILLGMLAGLIIVLAVLITSLMCTRRNYRRKLKAAKAMNSASMMASDNQKGGPVVPGTNKYTMEGANPVLNLNIDPAIVLGLDQESSDDKVSLNSLDWQDDSTSEKETKSTMEMSQADQEPPVYVEALDVALAQRDQRKGSDSLRVGFKNPVFSTTDL